jgi:hypothetical protein
VRLPWRGKAASGPAADSYGGRPDPPGRRRLGDSHATRGGGEDAARDPGAPGGIALLRESTSSTNRGRDTGGGARLGGDARAARLGFGWGPRGGGGGLNRAGHLLACGPRLGMRVQGGDGGGAVESGLDTTEVGDDNAGPTCQRERAVEALTGRLGCGLAGPLAAPGLRRPCAKQAER